MAHSHQPQTHPAGPKSKLIGLLAQFDDPDSLIAACDRARQAGYQKMDAYSPFPVHGIDPAIGIRRSRLPFFVLAVGLFACAFGLLLQYYCNAVDWVKLFPGFRYFISGKPDWSWPANVPVMFEIIVLSSAFAAFLGMWALNRLPRLANPLQRIERFRRATNDKFFLMIETSDEKFEANRTRQQLEEWGAVAIENCDMDLTDQQIPQIFKMIGLVLLMLLFVPPVLIFRAYGMTNRSPRLHVVPDMDWQDKYKAQHLGPNMGSEKNPNYLFADLRAARLPIDGTVARGELEDDDRYFRGYEPGTLPVAMTTPAAGATSTEATTVPGHGPNESFQEPAKEAVPAVGAQQPAADGTPPAPPEPKWVETFPAPVSVTEATMQRGRQRFEIYCSACHGYAGNGDGLVNQRALSLAVTGQAQWTTAKSLHDPLVKPQPVGRIYDTITNGRNTMGPYRSQIPIADRWAIVLYVKALQETGIQPPVSLTPAPETPAPKVGAVTTPRSQ